MKMRWWVFSIFLMNALVILFQNCAGSMQAANLSSLDMYQSVQTVPTPAPTPTSPFRTNLIDSRAGLNDPIQISFDAMRFPEGTTLLWDHLLADGQTYCRQTSSLDKLNLTLSCPNVGALRVSLYLTEPNGTESMLTVDITVVDSVLTTPTPTPTPTAINGGALYAQHCSGCHGPLATSTKRNITLARLNSGISSVSSMSSLGSLSPAQRQAIVTALQ